MAADEGLIQSRNTVSVRVGELAGLDGILRFRDGRQDSRTSPDNRPSTLEAFESTLSEVTSAYTVLANLRYTAAAIHNRAHRRCIR
jgi:penicillin-binding protein 1A